MFASVPAIVKHNRLHGLLAFGGRVEFVAADNEAVVHAIAFSMYVAMRIGKFPKNESTKTQQKLFAVQFATVLSMVYQDQQSK